MNAGATARRRGNPSGRAPARLNLLGLLGAGEVEDTVEGLGRLGTGDRVPRIGDEAGNGVDAKRARAGLVGAGLRHFRIGGEIVVELILGETGRGADAGQHVAIADVEATLEITPEQGLDHVVLAAR